jgi:hypothetical protein
MIREKDEIYTAALCEVPEKLKGAFFHGLDKGTKAYSEKDFKEPDLTGLETYDEKQVFIKGFATAIYCLNRDFLERIRILEFKWYYDQEFRLQPEREKLNQFIDERSADLHEDLKPHFMRGFNMTYCNDSRSWFRTDEEKEAFLKGTETGHAAKSNENLYLAKWW